MDASPGQYHAGQIVTPVVHATRLPGGSTYRVEWYWYDAGDRTTSGRGVVVGTYRECVAALKAAGIRTDDHRF